MFFFEWVIPLAALAAVGIWIFYLSLRGRVNAGVRTDGTTVVDKPTPEDAERHD